MENTKQVLYIEDGAERKLYYNFTPAAISSNFIPLVVILHDHKRPQTPSFEYKMWNILTPLDNFGYENEGSAWLGEVGEYYVKDLLQELIHKYSDAYECQDHIYIYGESVGGYGAIMHGILCKANTVYTHNPHITMSIDKFTDSFYNAIFFPFDVKENNLNTFLNVLERFPIFYFSQTSESPQGKEIEEFIEVCKNYDIACYKEEHQEQDDEVTTIKKVLDMLEYMTK